MCVCCDDCLRLCWSVRPHRDINGAAIQALHSITKKTMETWLRFSEANPGQFGALRAALKGPKTGYGRLTVKGMMSPIECTETLFTDFRDDV